MSAMIMVESVMWNGDGNECACLLKSHQVIRNFFFDMHILGGWVRAVFLQFRATSLFVLAHNNRVRAVI